MEQILARPEKGKFPNTSLPGVSFRLRGEQSLWRRKKTAGAAISYSAERTICAGLLSMPRIELLKKERSWGWKHTEVKHV